MAICWTGTINQLDSDVVFAPERYSARRTAHSSEVAGTVPLHELVKLNKSTINPASNAPDQQFVVLDTTNAVEGRIQFSSLPVNGDAVGSVKRPVDLGCVMISRLRTYLRQVAFVDEGLAARYKTPIICSTEFYLLESINSAFSIAFLVPYLLSGPVQAIFANSQEGGHHPRIHASVLLDLRVPKAIIEKRKWLSDRVIKSIETFREAETILEECNRALLNQN